MLVSSISDELEAYCRETGDVVDLKRDPAPALTPRHCKRHRSSVEPLKVAANAARDTFVDVLIADVLIAGSRTRLAAGSRIRFRIRYQIPAESTLESTVQELLTMLFLTQGIRPRLRIDAEPTRTTPRTQSYGPGERIRSELTKNS